MPSSLRDTKRRISSVKNTQKITKAMKLVAAAKFARAYQTVQKGRPYETAFMGMVHNVLKSHQGELSLPLLEKREEKRILLIVVSTDRGLCGSLNTSIMRLVQEWLDKRLKQGQQVDLWAWGRKGRLYLQRRKANMVANKEGLLDKPSFGAAKSLSRDVINAFSENRFDCVYVAYPKFRSALSQTPVVEQILPLNLSEFGEDGKSQVKLQQASFLVEPNTIEFLQKALEHRVISQVFKVLIESSASELGARMTAMDSATNNAGEVIRRLTLVYNRARQAAITKELIEIISGAEAQ